MFTFHIRESHGASGCCRCWAGNDDEFPARSHTHASALGTYQSRSHMCIANLYSQQQESVCRCAPPRCTGSPWGSPWRWCRSGSRWCGSPEPAASLSAHSPARVRSTRSDGPRCWMSAGYCPGRRKNNNNNHNKKLLKSTYDEHSFILYEENQCCLGHKVDTRPGCFMRLQTRSTVYRRAWGCSLAQSCFEINAVLFLMFFILLSCVRRINTNREAQKTIGWLECNSHYTKALNQL